MSLIPNKAIKTSCYLIGALAIIALMLVPATGCSKSTMTAKNPDTATVVSVDRFSDAFAHLFARSKNSSMPAANAPINMDQGPFITQGLGPQSGHVTYYNFDVLPTTPAPIYVLYKQGSSTPVAGQLNIIDLLPGDPGYNDFWNIMKVTVPSNYVANSITSLSEIQQQGYTITPTTMLVNCPVVPAGSTANLRYNTSEAKGLQSGWYRDQVVKYFTFAETTLSTTTSGMVPLANIYVCFNLNPDSTNPASGPPSGFKTETGSLQTHNVPDTLPTDAGYSPLWKVNIYDNGAFPTVSNLATALKAPLLAPGAAIVNCPIVAAS